MFDIKKFCFDLNISQAAFGEVIGEAQSVVSHMAKGVRKIRLEHIEKLRAKYGDIVNNYFIDGEVRPVQPARMSPHHEGCVSDVEGAYSVEDLTGCDVHCPAKLPYVKSEIVQSRDINIRQLIERDAGRLEHRSMRELVGGDVDYIQKVITGAMMPLFQPGDYLFIRFLPDDAKLISGAIYLVDSKAYGAMVRQVYVNDDKLHLHSINPEFKELEVHRSEIYSISLVVRSLRSDFNPPNTPDMAGMFAKREEQMMRLLDMHDSALKEISLQNERLERERERQDKLIDKMLGKI